MEHLSSANSGSEHKHVNTYSDKLEGRRLRFTCGHTLCDKCVEEYRECQLCDAPLSPEPYPKLDERSTHRAHNASELLKCFETAFSVKLNERIRLSEQLKIEKEVFPKCIQAFTKYSNKAKEENLSINSRKSSQSFFLGENISLDKSLKMQKSSYVQEWLERSEKLSFESLPRIPLGCLNVNSPRATSKTPLSLKKASKKLHHNQNLFNKEHTSRIKTRKRRSIPDFFTENSGCYDNFSQKRTKKNESEFDNNTMNSFSEPILIEDSQSEQYVDKDREALLAVMQADKLASKQAAQESQMTLSLSQKTNVQPTHKLFKIPFYKKGYITEPCRHCALNISENKSATSFTKQNKDLSITIENDSFSTIINVENVAENYSKISKKFSVYVQTDLSCISDASCNDFTIKESKINLDNKQPPLKYMKGDLENRDSSKIFKSVVIADSDSDDSTDPLHTVLVEADVHNPSEQLVHRVLTELDPQDLQPRKGNSNRALTPCSSNSSEKENFDPNKSKRPKHEKKKK